MKLADNLETIQCFENLVSILHVWLYIACCTYWYLFLNVYIIHVHKINIYHKVFYLVLI